MSGWIPEHPLSTGSFGGATYVVSIGLRSSLPSLSTDGASVNRGSYLIALTTGLVWAANARAEGDPAQSVQAVVGGYDPGHGFVFGAPGGDDTLRVGLQAAYRVEPTFLDGKSQDRTAILSARPSVGGSFVRPWITFLTTAELADNPPYLLYSYLDVKPISAFGVRVGQQDTPFSRHENFGLYRVLFPETGPVAGYFWSGRDKGVTAYGSLPVGLDYYAGLYAGSPLRQYTTIAGNYVIEGRVTANPMGKMGDAEFAYVLGDSPLPTRISFTLQGYGGKIQSSTQNFDPDSFLFTNTATGMTTTEKTGGADVFLQSSRVMVLAEGYVRRTTPSDGSASYTSLGAWGQVSVLLVRRWLDFAVQGGWTNPSTSLSNDRFLGGEGQVTYYVKAPTLILKLRYAYADQQTPGTTALGSVTLPGTAGRTQLITLQVNLDF